MKNSGAITTVLVVIIALVVIFLVWVVKTFGVG